MPDEVLGQAIKAVIVLRQGATLDAMRVKAHCRDTACRATRFPKIENSRPSLPRTSSGKIRRYQLTGAASTI